MKVVALVPIKMNNERLPNKNIKPFDNGKPLCSYILDTLLMVNQIDEVYVYCSDNKIQEYLPPGVKFLRRSEGLDQNTTKINEVLAAFAHDITADIYVLAHTTAPFITAESIQRGLDKVLSEKYDSAFSAKLIQEFMWSDGKPLNYSLNSIPRTQDLPIIFAETSGFFIYNSATIINKNRRIGINPYIVEVKKIESIDIDTPEDFEIANAIYSKCKENHTDD